jgi:hypothetical protein
MSTTERDREPQGGRDREREERGGQVPQEQTRGPEGVGTPQPGGPIAEDSAEGNPQQPGGHAQPGTPQSGRTP